MKIFLLVASLVGLLVVAVGGVLYAWVDMGDIEIGWHGIAALVLGVVLSLGLGIGLMFLVFYSARHGHDDRAGH